MKNYLIVDAHTHLWERQAGTVDGRPVFSVGGGKSNFGGEIRQMMPPDMDDNRCTVERLLGNMDYGGVSGCVVTQEYICLLYTSPSPRDPKTSRMPSSA